MTNYSKYISILGGNIFAKTPKETFYHSVFVLVENIQNSELFVIIRNERQW